MINRLEKVCPGDCSKCELLSSGQVEMVSCMVDQIFQRSKQNQEAIKKLAEQIEGKFNNLEELICLNGNSSSDEEKNLANF